MNSAVGVVFGTIIEEGSVRIVLSGVIEMTIPVGGVSEVAVLSKALAREQETIKPAMRRTIAVIDILFFNIYASLLMCSKCPA